MPGKLLFLGEGAREVTPAAIIAVIDARADEVDDLRRDVADILAQCREYRADVPVVIGLALHEIEIWMLADEDARVAAFGADVGRVPLADAAEDIGDPKQVWATYAGKVAAPSGISDDQHRDNQRRAAWESLRSRVVAHACPLGFAPFAGAVPQLLRTALGGGARSRPA